MKNQAGKPSRLMEIFGRKRVDGRGVIHLYVAIKTRFENLAWRTYGFRNG